MVRLLRTNKATDRVCMRGHRRLHHLSSMLADANLATQHPAVLSWAVSRARHEARGARLWQCCRGEEKEGTCKGAEGD